MTVANALPKGPWSALPQLAHMRDPFPLMLRLSKQYEDPFTCPLLGQDPMVLTWSPGGVSEVWSAEPNTFAPGTSDALAVIVGQGSIFLKRGDGHRRARKLLMPPFHGERMRAYGNLMYEIAERWARTIEPGQPRPILEITQSITLDIIVEAIFGVRREAHVAELRKGIVELVDAFNPLIAGFRFMQRDFGGFGPWAKFRKRADALQALMRAQIEAKREAPGEDILSLLLAVRDEGGNSLPEQEIMEQLLSFVVAGHETTATSLAWAMYEIHRSEPVRARVESELTSVELRNAPDKLAKSPYLQAIANETLRMHPPVPIVPRRCARPFTLGNYTLPEGTNLGVAIYLAHHREETFPSPFEFRPERFLERSYSPFEFIPFGGGARRCLGAAFASYELPIVLGALLSRGRFALDEPRPVGNAFRIGTFGPATGVRMMLEATA